jgi:Amt family ammonium transporter
MNEVDGIAVTFPVTAGYAVSGLHGDTPAELIEYAAFAQHEALRGKNEKLNPFNRDRYDEVKRSALRRTFIKDIIDRNQLSVVFQPIVSLKTGELFGFEALSRPLNPIYRNIVDLIDDAEASGHYAILEKRMVYNALDA